MEKPKDKGSRFGIERPQEPLIESTENINTVHREKSGWSSPEYSKSESTLLDPKTIAENRCIAILPKALETESYRVLRTQILHLTRHKGWNTVMITSALPGEGKTLTAINLTLTLATEFNHTVLLVDCDLRRQNVHRMLGLKSEKGLIDYLLNDRPISELIIWPGIDKFTLISGGRTVHNSAEILGSPRMKELVVDMKTRYPERYVFFDVPPVLSVADAIVFAPLVDCILFVVKSGTTSINDVKKALEMIPKEKVLGLVLNQQKVTASEYYSRAYYSK